jgi:hypothetical protein
LVDLDERWFLILRYIIDLSNRGQNLNQSTHVINVEIKDNHEDALLGGRAILQLAQMVRMRNYYVNVISAYN